METGEYGGGRIVTLPASQPMGIMRISLLLGGVSLFAGLVFAALAIFVYMGYWSAKKLKLPYPKAWVSLPLLILALIWLDGSFQDVLNFGGILLLHYAVLIPILGIMHLGRLIGRTV
jgi:hypothetical protein